MCYLVTTVDSLSSLPQTPSLRLGLPQVAQQQFLKHAGTCLMVQNHGLETHMNRPLGQQWRIMALKGVFPLPHLWGPIWPRSETFTLTWLLNSNNQVSKILQPVWLLSVGFVAAPVEEYLDYAHKNPKTVCPRIRFSVSVGSLTCLKDLVDKMQSVPLAQILSSGSFSGHLSGGWEVRAKCAN